MLQVPGILPDCPRSVSGKACPPLLAVWELVNHQASPALTPGRCPRLSQTNPPPPQSALLGCWIQASALLTSPRPGPCFSLEVRCCTRFSLIQDLKDAITQTEHYGQDSAALSMVSTTLRSHPLGFPGNLHQDLGFPDLTQSAAEREEGDICFLKLWHFSLKCQICKCKGFSRPSVIVAFAAEQTTSPLFYRNVTAQRRAQKTSSGQGLPFP